MISIQELKTTILTSLVVASFYFSFIGWRHYESSESTRVLVAGLILGCMYILMIFELVNRNLAALIGAALSIAAYDCLVEFASMEQIVGWEDLETLALLFGMMTIVNVLGDSGLFDYLAVFAYERSKGRFWLLVSIISTITAVLSAVVDNVSTMLLVTPTLIKICELEQMDPRCILLIVVMFSNIGGCATPVGDPPNLIIIGDPLIASLGISFNSFTLYCTPCVLICMASSLIYMKIRYKSKEGFEAKGFRRAPNKGDLHDGIPLQITGRSAGLKTELVDEWKLFTSQLGREVDANLQDGTNLEFKHRLDGLIDRHSQNIDMLSKKHLDISSGNHECDGWSVVNATSLTEEPKQPRARDNIRDMSLLVKACGVLLVTIFLFFMQSHPNFNKLSLGWISIFGGLSLLVLTSTTRVKKHELDANNHETEELFDRVINKVEWSTLMFFFSLFLVMEVMSKLGLLSHLGHEVSRLIELLPSGRLREIGAISIILWTSGIASMVIDNVPFTSMMIKLLGTLILRARRSAEADQMRLEPLVFALAFGASFGGNGTLIGASANLVTVGIANRHGYPISFNKFAKFCAPVTFLTLVIANIYLVIVFVVLDL